MYVVSADLRGKTRSFLSQRRISNFITDARYTEQASYECPDYELVNWRIDFGYSMGKAVAYCADKDGVKTIGFEQDHLINLKNGTLCRLNSVLRWFRR